MSKRFRYIPIIVLLLFLSLLLFSCKKGKTTSEPGTFSLDIAGSVLTWSAVEGADRYELRCELPEGARYSVTVRDITFTVPQGTIGDYLYQVTAVAGNGAVIARSNEVVYHLGKGSHLDPILISSVEELKAITTGCYSKAFGGKVLDVPLYYKLTKDLDLSNVTMTPIGTSDSDAFKGSFDGDGHVISNLTLTKSNSQGRIGLFGYLSKAVVKNLTLQNAKMVMNNNSGVTRSGLEYGLLAARSNESVIDNCHVIGDIDFLKNVDTTGSSYVCVGGILGAASGGKIFASSFEGEILARYSQVNVGGIVGYIWSGDQHFVMANCLSKATVTAVATGKEGTTSYAKARAGVLAGTIAGAYEISANLAVGVSKAETPVEGTLASDIVSGVFGNTAGSSSTNTISIRNLFYSTAIEKVSGNRSILGEGNTAYPLTEEAFRSAETFLDAEGDSLLDDAIWTMGANHPVHRGVSQGATHEDLTIAIRDEISESSFDFSFNDSFLPLYYTPKLNRVDHYYAGVMLNDLLTTLGLSLEGAVNVVISAEGADDIVLPVSTSSTFASTYLCLGNYGSFSSIPQTYSGVFILNAGTKESFTLSANTLTITIVKAQNED